MHIVNYTVTCLVVFRLDLVTVYLLILTAGVFKPISNAVRTSSLA